MGISTAFRSLGLVSDTKRQTSTVQFECASEPGTQCQAPLVASLVSMPIYNASLQTFMNNPD